jgi:hypothetical protein
MQVCPAAANIPGNRSFYGIIQICVVEDDVGRLAAKFQRNTLERFCRCLVDGPAARFATSEGNALDERMIDQRFAGLSAHTGNDIDHAGRKAGFLEQLPQVEHRSRGVFRRLNDYGVSRRKRWCEFPNRQDER